MMKRTLPTVLSLLLLLWGGFYFSAQVERKTPETGVEWIDTADGVVAEAVIPRRPAWRGGLRPGDRLLAVEGRAVQSAREARQAPLAHPEGQALSFRVERDSGVAEAIVRPAWVGGGEPVYYYLALVALTFLGVGMVVWLSAARARAALPFALLCQAMFLLLVFRGTGQGSPGLLEASSYWADLAGILLAPALFLHITWILAEEGHGPLRRRPLRALLYLVPLLLFLFNLYLIPFKGVYRFADPEAAIRLKARLEQACTAVYVILGIVRAVRSYLSAERLQTRWQLRWMAWGSLVGFLPAALFYLVPRALDIRIAAWSELSLLPMAIIPLAFAAAIVRYRLLDLDIFLKRGIVAIGLLLSAAATYGACYILMDRATGGVRARGFNLALILTTFLMATFYPRLHRRLKTVVDQFFYRERYDYRRTLTEFGEALNRELNLPSLALKFTARVERTFALERAVVVVRDRQGRLRPAGSAGPALDPSDRILGLLRQVDYLSLRDHPGILEASAGARLLDGLGIEYLLPMTVEGEIVALLGAGRPRAGEPLTSEDLQLLVSLCRHGAVAFEGARLYGAVQDKVREVEALREFNESILESSRVGILVTDPEGRVAGVNRAFEALYGTRREAILGRPLPEVIPEGVLGAPDGLEVGRGALPEEGIKVYRSSLWTAAGRRLLVNLTKAALRDGDGRPRGEVITVDDVTEQVAREEDLQRREHLASIGLLASGIAHEVNTPLTGISSYTQVLLEGRPADDPAYPILRKIEQQAFRAAGIASSLLNFSRQGEGDHEPLDIAEVIGEALQLFEPHLRGRNVRFERRVGAGLPRILGNRGRLQQVLMNLLLNAVDAMPRGGTLTLAASAAAGRVRIEVADTGVGIPPEHIDRIYDPFFTTKPRGRGTGLGLSVSYGIIKEHAGTLTAESTPGEGSRFIASLPAAGAGGRRVTA